MKAGFALPAVLVITGAVCLALLAAVGAIDSLARSARETVERGAFETRALDLEAKSAFAALTLPTTSSAMIATDRRGRATPVFLDGSPYAAGPGLEVSLQDEAGLININGLPVEAFPRLFRQFGVAPDAALGLADRLADYLDRDDLVRPRGAETADYLKAGRPPPPDAPLRSRAQLLGVLGWSEAAPAGAWRTARDLVVADDVNIGSNINTSPAPVLIVRYGLDAAQADRAVARRRARPFETLEDLGRAAGLRLVGDAERSVTRPSGRLRFALAAPRAQRLYASRIVLTPDDPARPFRVEDRALSLPPAARTGQVAAHAASLPFASD